VRLQCIRVGGAWLTSMEAFQRFCERLSELENSVVPTTVNTPPGVTEQSERHQDQVEQALKDRGA
jgi:hypothetical protein